MLKSLPKNAIASQMVSRRKFLSNSVASVIGFYVASFSRLEAKEFENKAITEKIIFNLDKNLPNLMAKNAVPGVSLAIVKNQEIIYFRSIGVKNRNTREPVNNDTVFAAASLSKPLFAYAVVKMSQQGKLNLDTPLTEYTDRPYISDPRIKQITARMVLSHTTGFPNWSGDDPVWIESTPGTKFSYSGEGYLYLQRVVEQISRQPLEEYMSKNILTRLGMKNSSYIWQPDYERLATNGHDRQSNPMPLSKPKEALSAGSLRTTASDYAQFLKVMINRDSKDIDKMLSQQIKINSLINWGLGWGLENTLNGDFFWHWGDGGYFKSFTLGSRRLKIAMVILTNSQNGLKICPDIVRQSIGGQHPAFNFGLINY